MISRSRYLSMLAIVGVLVGCADGDRLRLAEDQLDPRLRSRMNADLVGLDAGVSVDAGPCANGPCAPSVVVDMIWSDCAGQAVQDLPAGSPSACLTAQREAARDVCLVHRLIEMAESPTSFGVGTSLRTRPQDVETNAALLSSAMTAALIGMTEVDEALRTSGTCSSTDLGQAAGGTAVGLTRGEQLANFYAEFALLAEEASLGLAEAASASSDNISTWATDSRDAARLQLESSITRLAAAHALVGGDDGLEAIPRIGTSQTFGGVVYPAEGLYSPRVLSAEEARAMSLLRQAAQNPRWIVDRNTTLEQLLVGGGDVTFEESTRYRLSRYLDRPSLRNSGTTGATLASVFDVSVAAFGVARDQLAYEIYLFNRTYDQPGTLRQSRTLPVERLPDGSLTSASTPTVGSVPGGGAFSIYSGTRLPSPERPSAYWAAVLRYELRTANEGLVSGSPNTEQTLHLVLTTPGLVAVRGLPGTTWGERSTPIAGYVDGAPNYAAQVQSLAERTPYTAAYINGLSGYAQRDAVRNTLARAGAVMGSTGSTNALAGASVLGRVRACTSYSNPTTTATVTLTLARQPGSALAAPNTNTVAVVSGTEGLECATEGTVDGTTCTQSELTSYTRATFASNSATTASFAWGANGGRGPRVDEEYVFLVRARSSAAGATRPGDFEVLTGFVLNNRTVNYCVTYPITPDVERRAADLIRSSAAHPNEPDVSCTGLSSSLEIPLENELTEDFNQVESSWSHYITLAQQAADEADAIGEDLIRTGLELDARAQQQSDQLQSLCGVQVSASRFIDQLPAASAVTPCSNPYVESGGICVLDPIAFAITSGAVDSDDGRRLHQCLSESANIPFVGVGSQPLCMWRDASGELCGDANGRVCPFRLAAGGVCDAAAVPAMTTPVPVNDLLRMFAAPQTPPPIPPPDAPPIPPCEALARARAGSATAGDVEAAVAYASNRDNLRRVAALTTWYPAAGDYSSVRFDGEDLITTGAWGQPASLAWPQGTAVGSGTPLSATTFCPNGSVSDPRLLAANKPLFCLDLAAYDGSEQDPTSSLRRRRARANDLIGRAVIAARVFTGVGLQGIEVPFYPRFFGHAIGLANASPSASDYSDDVYTVRGASLRVDHSSSDGAGPEEHSFSTLGLRAEYVRNQGDLLEDGVDWMRCPWNESACSEVFDNERNPTAVGSGSVSQNERDFFHLDRTSNDEWHDEDDVREGSWRLDSDRDLPLLIRTLPASSLGGSLEEDSLAFFHDPTRSLANLVRTCARGDTPYFWNSIPAAFEQGTRGIGGRGSYFLQDNSVLPDCNPDAINGCLTRSPSDLDWASTPAGNRAWLGQRSFSDASGVGDTGDQETALVSLRPEDVLNGLELLCVLDRRTYTTEAAANRCDELPTSITTMRDVFRLQRSLECTRDRINESAGQTVLANLPTSLVEAMRGDGGGVFGQGIGLSAEQLAQLRNAVLALPAQQRRVAGAVGDIAAAIRQLEADSESVNLQSEIADLRLMQTVSNQATSCAVAAASSVGIEFAVKPGQGLATAATCVNSIVNIGLEARITDLSQQGDRAQLRSMFANFERSARAAATSLHDASDAIRASMNTIDAQVASLRANQQSARRALAQALFLEQSGTNAHFAANRAYRERYSQVLARYTEMRGRGLRYAFIARRALEQRLGMSLSSIREDLPTVAAPAGWVDGLCALPAIDYDRLRDTPPPAGGERESTNQVAAPSGYDGSYLGDYVRKLRDTYEGYGFAYPFRAGTDTAVISLRDDVYGVLEDCVRPSANLLYHSSSLDRWVSSSGDHGWEVVGCPVSSSGTYFPVDDECLGVSRAASTDAASTVYRSGQRIGAAPVPMRIVAGGAEYSSDARVRQQLDLTAGRYRLSWFAYEVTPTNGASWVQVRQDDAVVAASPAPIVVTGEFASTSGPWRRYYRFFDVAEPGPVEIAVTAGTLATTSSVHEITVAGLMLEDVSEVVRGSLTASGRPSASGVARTVAESAVPPVYEDTGETLTVVAQACRDNDGSRLRSTRFTQPVCVSVCPDGYGGQCPETVRRQRCGFDLSIPLGAGAMQRALEGRPAGFAAGNHNYRIDSIGVNLVGVGLRDCDDTQSCYASGNLSYSMLHSGPFTVVNARGEEYDAPLFPGRIESARALAAERYVTNPISSADQSLIQPYMRNEFQGRPLGGTLTLRIWDDPGFQFQNLEDVQIVLNYRYWTHQR